MTKADPVSAEKLTRGTEIRVSKAIPDQVFVKDQDFSGFC
jgi:hypothetical protein